jgi:tetratricopeptide (TPR) repeat protein
MRIAFLLLACFLFLPLSGQKKWERMAGKFDRHYDRTNFEAALKDASKILDYSLVNLDSTDSRYARSNYYMAKAYVGLSDPEEAKSYILSAYELMAPNLAYDGTMVEVCRLYGEIETQLGYHKSAAYLLSRALEISLELYGTESLSYLLSLYAMANLEMAMAQWDLMVGVLTEALQIHERNFPLDAKYAEFANYMGLLFMNSERFQEAILYFNKSIEVYSTPGLKEDLTCANAHNNLGLIFYYRSEFEDAAEHFELAGAIYQKLTEGYSESFMMLLSNRASLYFAWEKDEMLHVSYLALGEYLERHGVRTDLSYIQGVENMANFYAVDGNFEKSEVCFLRAIETRKKMDPVDQEGLQRTILSLVEVCEDFNHLKKASYYREMANGDTAF